MVLSVDDIGLTINQNLKHKYQCQSALNFLSQYLLLNIITVLAKYIVFKCSISLKKVIFFKSTSVLDMGTSVGIGLCNMAIEKCLLCH